MRSPSPPRTPVQSPPNSVGDSSSPPMPRFSAMKASSVQSSPQASTQPGSSPPSFVTTPGALPPRVPTGSPFPLHTGPIPIPPLSAMSMSVPKLPDDLAGVDFASMPVPDDTWLAVEQLEAALEGVRFGVEQQLNVIEADTENLESMYHDLRGHVMTHELLHGPDGMRSLLVCYFPREANKEMIRQAFSPYGAIDSVYLVHKDGKPACYGFVNFHDNASAARALAAANAERVELVDKRNVIWHVKAEWTLSSDIPKKPKKKRGKKKDEGVQKSEESPTPPVALNRAMKGYHPKMTLSGLPQHARIAHSLSYTVPTMAQVSSAD